ncbi:hypothetical protein N7467_007010 [Penicillium canescens]|nr:hypothetical protein N7467_007010 [Penicillium canescens]
MTRIHNAYVVKYPIGGKAKAPDLLFIQTHETHAEGKRTIHYVLPNHDPNSPFGMYNTVAVDDAAQMCVSPSPKQAKLLYSSQLHYIDSSLFYPLDGGSSIAEARAGAESGAGAKAGAEAIKEHIVFCHHVNGTMFWTSEMLARVPEIVIPRKALTPLESHRNVLK